MAIYEHDSSTLVSSIQEDGWGIHLKIFQLEKIFVSPVYGQSLDELFPEQAHSVPCYELSPGKSEKITLSRSDGEAFYAELMVSSFQGS